MSRQINWQMSNDRSFQLFRFKKIENLKPRPSRMTLSGKHFEFCLSMYLKLFKNFLLVTSKKNVCQARVCVVAKPTNVVLVKQTFKCLPSNICPFGQGLIKNIDKQNVLLNQCLSWWPNAQAYLTSKIQNVCQTMSFCLARDLDFQFF